MTNQIVKATSKSDRSQEINNLHSELESMFRRALPMAIRIGELLEIQKEELPHGEFGPWIDQNLHFTKQTAHNYRKLYRIRKQLKSKRILLLNEAYIEAGVLHPKTKVAESEIVKSKVKGRKVRDEVYRQSTKKRKPVDPELAELEHIVDQINEQAQALDNRISAFEMRLDKYGVTNLKGKKVLIALLQLRELAKTIDSLLNRNKLKQKQIEWKVK